VVQTEEPTHFRPADDGHGSKVRLQNKVHCKNTVGICRELPGILLALLQKDELNYVAFVTEFCYVLCRG
jgi:hypothetical protein